MQNINIKRLKIKKMTSYFINERKINYYQKGILLLKRNRPKRRL